MGYEVNYQNGLPVFIENDDKQNSLLFICFGSEESSIHPEYNVSTQVKYSLCIEAESGEIAWSKLDCVNTEQNSTHFNNLSDDGKNKVLNLLDIPVHSLFVKILTGEAVVREVVNEFPTLMSETRVERIISKPDRRQYIGFTGWTDYFLSWKTDLLITPTIQNFVFMSKKSPSIIEVKDINCV